MTRPKITGSLDEKPPVSAGRVRVGVENLAPYTADSSSLEPKPRDLLIVVDWRLLTATVVVLITPWLVLAALATCNSAPSPSGAPAPVSFEVACDEDWSANGHGRGLTASDRVTVAGLPRSGGALPRMAKVVELRGDPSCR